MQPCSDQLKLALLQVFECNCVAHDEDHEKRGKKNQAHPVNVSCESLPEFLLV